MTTTPKDTALAQLDEAMSNVRVNKEREQQTRSDAEEAVLAALDAGATFREIATTSRRSVSWVQSILYRRAPERIKRRESSRGRETAISA